MQQIKILTIFLSMSNRLEFAFGDPGDKKISHHFRYKVAKILIYFELWSNPFPSFYYKYFTLRRLRKTTARAIATRTRTVVTKAYSIEEGPLRRVHHYHLTSGQKQSSHHQETMQDRNQKQG